MKNGHNNHHPDSGDDETTVVSNSMQRIVLDAVEDLSIARQGALAVAQGLGVTSPDRHKTALKDFAAAMRLLGMGCHDYARAAEEHLRNT